MRDILTPVGRFVQGSLYSPRTTNFDGTPLVYKTGAQAGQPRVEYFIALAIPKTPGVAHWANEPWGRPIWEEGHAAFPNIANNKDFAWKITDGDSTEVNKKGNRPCDNEGFAGCWVLKFSGGMAPTIASALTGQVVPLIAENAVNLGDYIEVSGNVDKNTGQSPGLYMNHRAVCLRGYGQRIVTGVDVTKVGFGASALPQGASTTPVGSALAPQPPGGAPLPPTGPSGAPAPTAPPPLAPLPAATVVQPHTTILTPGAPPSPPAPNVGPVMTAKAGAFSYQSFIDNGWTHAALVQGGYVVG